MEYDVIIIGGSYAGISAALQLARARRKILVIDGGNRRNRFASHSHGFFAQDGRDSGVLVSEARAQLLDYPTVQWLSQVAIEAAQRVNGFEVTLDNGERVAGARLILASGVADQLPDIPGLAQRWGTRVFHCPYCHGYELDGGPIGVLAVSPLAIHQALMLPDWGPTTLFLNQTFEPDGDQLANLERRGVTLERESVTEMAGQAADVTLASGRVVHLAGLFTQTRTHMASPLALQLGCAFEEGPMGPFIQVDAMRETSISGVFACGDAAVAAGNVAISVGDGARTGAGAHQSLIFR